MAGYSLKEKMETNLFCISDFEGDALALTEAKRLEKEFYNEVLDRVIANPRFYLDNLDKLSVFYVSFLNNNHKKSKI